MLGKLVKYDFKAMSRMMFPVFLAMVALSLIFALMIKLKLDNGLAFGFISSCLGVVSFGSCFYTVFCIASRFNQGLLRNEGYLSFALPVSTGTHILAKVLNGVIWSALEGLAVLLCTVLVGLVLASSQELLESFRFIMQALHLIDADIIRGLVNATVLLTLELISSVCLIYAAFALAHLFEKHKMLIMAALVVAFVVLRTVIMTNVGFNIDAFAWSSMYFWYLSAIIPIAIYLPITWFILDRRLNLE